ncbi:MAG: AbrB/MazE/SpoVT family DNA-binding domain-containing protein [Bdellovibrionia bacterium]
MTVKISSKYQVVIPEEARKSLDLRPGTSVDVIVKGGIAFLVPVKPLSEIRKNLKGKLSSTDVKSLREKNR